MVETRRSSRKRAAPEAKAEEAKATKPAKRAAPSTQQPPKTPPSVTLPDIALLDEEGNEVKIADLTKTRGAVLFLYPRASTPGCTVQGCLFRDAYSRFTALGYDVYGLSMDKPNAQRNFKTKQSFPYHLLSDPDAVLVRALGATNGPGRVKRSHFVFAPGGELTASVVGVSPKESADLALQAIERKG